MTTPAIPRELGRHLELFTDRLLIDSMKNLRLKLHTPQMQPLSASPLKGTYITILKDGGLFRAYYRLSHPEYTGAMHDGNPGELTCYAESSDGIEWEYPDLGLYKSICCGDFSSDRMPPNVILAGQPPFSHNFSPFIDTAPGVPAEERFKAVSGLSFRPLVKGPTDGLHAFVSADGIHWRKKSDKPLIPFDPAWNNAFDSQSSIFYSEAEQKYVCYFRSMVQPGNLRGISRTDSPDFEHWSEPVALNANLPDEHLYTNQTHPYCRAPHIYLALPTRYTAGIVNSGQAGSISVGSTDILFMSTRAGSAVYDRLFTKALIRPGLDPARWEDRANYAALNIIQSTPEELSIYHTHSGRRYTLRTDGFISVTADEETGELLTPPLTFSGSELFVNYSTSAAGSLRIEILDEALNVIPGFSRDDFLTRYGDEIEGRMSWRDTSSLAALAGPPVRLRFIMREADLYSLQFR